MPISSLLLHKSVNTDKSTKKNTHQKTHIDNNDNKTQTTKLIHSTSCLYYALNGLPICITAVYKMSQVYKSRPSANEIATKSAIGRVMPNRKYLSSNTCIRLHVGPHSQTSDAR